MINELTNQNFRYTFPKGSVTNLSLEEGLYTFSFRKSEVVISIDSFGEARVSNETPVNNLNKLALALRKAA